MVFLFLVYEYFIFKRYYYIIYISGIKLNYNEIHVRYFSIPQTFNQTN